jgi:hypothetical protein
MFVLILLISFCARGVRALLLRDVKGVHYASLVPRKSDD